MTEKTKSTTFYFGLILLVALMLGVTAYCGLLTERWAPFTGLEEARKVLRELPMKIGDWEASEDRPLSKDEIAMLQIENGYVCRRYKNTTTQAEVNLVLMIGKTGLVTAHTPEFCFGGRNFEKEKTRSAVAFPIVHYSGKGPTDDMFWKVNFVNRAAQGGTISFYYGFGVGDTWLASENPRFELLSYRYAYKLQAEAMVDGETDNVRQFLTDCLPTIQEHLRPCR